MNRHRTLLVVLVLLLVGAVINFPLAMSLDLSPAKQVGSKPVANLFGPAAASRPWPVRTPHAHAWPAPTQYSVSRAFGFSQIGVWSSPADGSSTTHQMSVDRIGWPLPCLERVQLYWPSSDPAWLTNAEQMPPARVRWSGALLNPVIFAASVWLVFLAPFQVRELLRRRVRGRRGQCPACGYPRGHGHVCPECGTPYAANHVDAGRGRSST